MSESLPSRWEPSPSSNSSRKQGAPQNPSVEMNLHTLYVEDIDIIRELTTAILQGAGLTVEAVSNGQEACEAFKRAATEGRPHELVLLDLQLPDMSGFDVAKFIKAHPEGAAVKTYLLTASVPAQFESLIASLGITGTLIKPVSRKTLVDLLKA